MKPISANRASHQLAQVYSPRASRRQQQGVVLFIALIVLVAMTLAGIAMMRQLGSGVGIAGNLAFRQNATTAADLGVEIAQNYIVTNTPTNLAVDGPAASGYYSTWDDAFNPMTFAWTNANSASAGTDGHGNDVRYVMHRMCKFTGLPNATAPQAQECVTLDSSLSAKTAEGNISNLKIAAALTPYFRVTAKANGPRNTVSYVQVMMY